jgi:hypothetical protein
MFVEFKGTTIRERAVAGFKRAKAMGVALSGQTEAFGQGCSPGGTNNTGNGLRRVTRNPGIVNGAVQRIRAEKLAD